MGPRAMEVPPSGWTMAYSHLTFDCYGTLIDWRRGIEENLGGLLRARGIRPRGEVFPLYLQVEASEEVGYKPYREVLAATAARVAERLGGQIPPGEAEGFAASVPLWPPFDDTREVLRELGRRGYRRVVLSNVDRDLLEATLARHRLEVDGFITAQDVRSYKPAPGHWEAFLKSYGAAREEVLHVAQSIHHDIAPASALGIATAWINRYGEPPPARVRPTHTLGDLAGLLTLLA